VRTYQRHHADRVLGEMNYGGDMVEHVIRTAEGGKEISYKNGTATRGKAIRAEPVAALYERGRGHHVGHFPHLEDEMVGWEPYTTMPSPNRMDALVWCISELIPSEPGEAQFAPSPFDDYRGD